MSSWEFDAALRKRVEEAVAAEKLRGEEAKARSLFGACARAWRAAQRAR
jgi:hypothetical protein